MSQRDFPILGFQSPPVKNRCADVLYYAALISPAFRPKTLKTNRFPLELVCLSDTGRVRTINEDAVAVDAKFGIAMIADGIGGHRAGDVASRMATDIVIEGLRSKVKQFRAGSMQSTPLQFAEQVIIEANQAIHSAAQKQPGCNDMGTTLALALFHDDSVALLHVGDSRIYRLRNGQLQLLTRDDSLLSDQVEHGLIAAKDAGDSHNRHLVTQALGIGASVPVHLREEEVRSGDVYLLCSDGLNDLVDDSDIELIIDSLKTNLTLAAGHLVQLANDNGGYDNISVALVRVGNAASSSEKKGWFARLFGWLS
jgi:protein phosphatase